MSVRSSSRLPLLALTALSTSLIVVGILLTVVLVGQWASPHWSRLTIVLQGGALLLGSISNRWRRSWRLLLYPVVLAGVLYLWDSTLPPPSLPDGPIRTALPLTMLSGIVVEVGLMVWQTLCLDRRFIDAYAGCVALDDVARIAGLSSEAVRRQSIRSGYPITTDAIGSEYLALSDVLTGLLPIRGRTAVFVRAHPESRPHDLPSQLEVLRWPFGSIWWLAITITVIVHIVLNTAFPQFRAAITNMVVLVFIVVAAALFWTLSLLRITINATMLTIWAGPLRERIPLAQIVVCSVTTYHWQAWGGFGRRLCGRDRLYNVPGDAGVAIELLLDNGRRILFSAHKPQITARLVRDAAARARQHALAVE